MANDKVIHSGHEDFNDIVVALQVQLAKGGAEANLCEECMWHNMTIFALMNFINAMQPPSEAAAVILLSKVTSDALQWFIEGKYDGLTRDEVVNTRQN